MSEPPKAICPCQITTEGYIYRLHVPGCPNELRDSQRKMMDLPFEPCEACGKPDGINHTYDCPEAQE